MSDIEICAKRLEEARAKEAEAFGAAMEALREAIRAKRKALYAQTALWEARGWDPKSFKKTYEETQWLSARENNPQCLQRCIRESIQPSTKFAILGF